MISGLMRKWVLGSVCALSLLTLTGLAKSADGFQRAYQAEMDGAAKQAMFPQNARLPSLGAA